MLGLFFLWLTFLRLLLKVRRPLPTELVVPYLRILLPSLFWEVTQNYFFSPLEYSYHLQFPVALDSAPLSHGPTRPQHILCIHCPNRLWDLGSSSTTRVSMPPILGFLGRSQTPVYFAPQLQG